MEPNGFFSDPGAGSIQRWSYVSPNQVHQRGLPELRRAMVAACGFIRTAAAPLVSASGGSATPVKPNHASREATSPTVFQRRGGVGVAVLGDMRV